MFYKLLLLLVPSVAVGMIIDTEVVSLNDNFPLPVNTAKLSNDERELLKTTLASIKQLHQQLNQRITD